MEQRAKGILGTSPLAGQTVTAVEAPRHLAFAGPLGTSAARWGMELEPLDKQQTDAMMWIEVDLSGPMRAIPSRMLERQDSAGERSRDDADQGRGRVRDLSREPGRRARANI